MDIRQTKYSQTLPGTIYYLGLHRPTIKGLYSGHWTNMNRGLITKKTDVDCKKRLR